MATFRHAAVADVPADDLFAFLRDPRNLPRYFPQMTVAEPKGGHGLHVEAEVKGRHVAGEAWLHTDAAHRKLSWGAESEADYHGELQITEREPGTSEVSVVLHTERTDSDEVQRGLEETVAALTHAAAADVDAGVADA
jgi:uncharacterized protein YndB with AHSA1/START domain